MPDDFPYKSVGGVNGLNMKTHYKRGHFMLCFCPNSFKHNWLIIQDGDQ